MIGKEIWGHKEIWGQNVGGTSGAESDKLKRRVPVP